MKTWMKILTLPGYLVQVITDVGAMETYDDSGIADKDDLRIAIELSGGHMVVVPPGARLVLEDNGDLTIEILTDITE